MNEVQQVKSLIETMEMETRLKGSEDRPGAT